MLLLDEPTIGLDVTAKSALRDHWLPVETVRSGDPLEALAMPGAAVLYGGLAVALFNRGLERYASGNRILELR